MVELGFVAIRLELNAALAGLDPKTITPAEAAVQVRALTAIENLAAGGRLVLLARAAEDRQWRQAGEASAADHLARQAGTTPGAVKEAIKASEQMADLPATQAAAAGGRLSPQQATAVASAAPKDPAAEPALLKAAEHESLSGLREECARVAAAATDQAERERIQRRKRFFRTWSDDDGSQCGRFSLPGVTGAELLAIFGPFRDQAFINARREGRHESYDNYAADGFMDMARAADDHRCSHLRPAAPAPAVPMPAATSGAPSASAHPSPDPSDGAQGNGPTGSGGTVLSLGLEPSSGIVPSVPQPASVGGPAVAAKPTGARRARIQVRCDYFALRRGHTEAGEIAEIPGVGPISIDAVRDLFDDAIIDILVTKGRDVTTIATNTRYIPQPLRIAIAERDQVCFIAGCHRRHRLEHDHLDLFSETHDTSFVNLHRACAHHHDLKTNRGHQFVDTPDGWQCLPAREAAKVLQTSANARAGPAP